MRSLLHINAQDVSFSTEPDGWHKGIVDVLAVTLGDNGQVLDQQGTSYTVRVGPNDYRRVLDFGFLYSIVLPIKKPGAYQLRTAVRDAATRRVGSAHQFVEVPDLGKGRLTLSGIAISGIKPASAPPSAAGAPVEPAGEVDPVKEAFFSQAGPALRKLQRGMLLHYTFVIYNAKLDPATKRPKLETRVRLFQETHLVFTGESKRFDPRNQTDWKRIKALGTLGLAKNMAPGHYILQVIVTDALAKEKYRTSTQWMDLEVVK